MKIDEAIKHCEMVAETKEEQAYEIAMMDGGDGVYMNQVSKCEECASEHRQLAEWLRELKNYRVFKEVLYSKCDEWCKFPEYKERGTMCGACEIGGIKDLLENALEEVKADEDSD